MKNIIKMMLLTSMLMLAFAITSFAQCEVKKIALTNGTATIIGITNNNTIEDYTLKITVTDK